MKTRFVVLLIPLFLLALGFRQSPGGPDTVIFSFKHEEAVICTDTLLIPYQKIALTDINDTLRKYLKNNGASVQSVMIAQPTLVIDSIDFTLFPEMRTLYLVGDPDQLADRRYNFMDAPKLHKVIAYQMSVDGAPDPLDYSRHGQEFFAKYIHKYRPDVKVRFNNKFHKTKLYHKL